MKNINQNIIQDLVGEIVDEKIEMMESIEPFEIMFSKNIIKKILSDFKYKNLITDQSNYKIINDNNKVVAKLDLYFIDSNVADELVNTRGLSLNLSQRWTYNKIDNNLVNINFEVK